MSQEVILKTNEENSGENTLQFLSFTSGESVFAVHIKKVKEIKGWTNLTIIPNAPEHIKGVMNLRGTIISVMDLKARFGEGITQPTEKHVIIVMSVTHEGKDQTVGILVDGVSNILTVSSSDIQNPKDIIEDEDNPFAGLLNNVEVENQENKDQSKQNPSMVILLDVDKVFKKSDHDFKIEIDGAKDERK